MRLQELVKCNKDEIYDQIRMFSLEGRATPYNKAFHLIFF